MVIIFGPTGVGKSDVAERLAHTLGRPTAIVNLDMGQCYTPLTIGTAKPAWQSSIIPHFLFDIIDEPRNFTVTEYRRILLETLTKLWSQGIVPIIVGGSGFYLKTIFYPPMTQIGQIPEGEEQADLWQKLHAIDPERAADIHPHDTYRLKRAMAIWRATGQKPSLFVPQYQPPADYFLLFLTRDRTELYERINDRVGIMIQSGWIDEVKKLCGTEWEQFLVDKKMIGYDDVLSYVKGSVSLGNMVQIIQQKTRMYAKRQHTFWRMLERELMQAQQADKKVQAAITSANLTSIDLDLYISQLSNMVLEKLK